MKDALLKVTKALPNAAANNDTDSIDLKRAVTPTGIKSEEWRLGYIEITWPALSDHTDTSKTNLITLHDSADDSSFAVTSPLIQLQVPGVASTGSVAATVKVPLPPDVKRYIRFNQLVPSGGGTGSNATVTYNLVV
jgi:hypothetical protein